MGTHNSKQAEIEDPSSCDLIPINETHPKRKYLCDFLKQQAL